MFRIIIGPAKLLGNAVARSTQPFGRSTIMLGWHVYVVTKKDSDNLGNEAPAVASWGTGLYGLRWIDELVKQGKAVDLGGNGYPCRYMIAADVLFPILRSDLPDHDTPPVVGDDYALPAGWTGELKLNNERMSSCAEDEPLVIEAWDQS